MFPIYLDGKENLEKVIPKDWTKPNKIMNHRSAKRIVESANSIRKNVDGKTQQYHSDRHEGNIMLFVCDKNLNKENVENYLGTKDIEFKEALASESGVGSFAYSVVLVRAKEGADIDGCFSDPYSVYAPYHALWRAEYEHGN